MAVITSILNRLGSKRINRIELFRKYPAETQMETFRSLVARATGTEWGKLHGYSSVTSIAEYQNRFQVQTYEDITPYVERLGKGETNLLWPGKIKWFAKSSGTTSAKSKFIPVSGESLNECHYRAAKDIMIIYSALNPDTRIFSGKNLTLGGSCKIDRFGAGALYGDLSAILIENAPAWTGMIRTPGKATALIEDFEEKLDRIVRLTIKENITGMAGVPSWYLVLVKQILAHTGKTDLMDVWPNFEVFFHGGISFTPYREQFRSLIKSDHVKYMETYNASEGFFGLQDNLAVNDMLLMLDYGIFYEFIPADT
ncbi:MAG: GH3 auxin-responsive promoter family protein, partial [Bacteroidales bacterium]|nr:GH3 auxin-responsive promoter family protein [Bacteroidales bacterium]